MERVGTRYVRSVAPPDLVDLLWQGVRATRVSAAPHHGLWTPLLEGRHVYRPRGVPELQESSDLVTHGNAMRSWPDRDPVASLELTLDHAARCLPVRDSAILFESALNSRRLSERDAQRIVAGLPSTRRH